MVMRIAQQKNKGGMPDTIALGFTFRLVSPIFLTLTSLSLSGVEGQGGNQGMITSCRELKVCQR